MHMRICMWMYIYIYTYMYTRILTLSLSLLVQWGSVGTRVVVRMQRVICQRNPSKHRIYHQVEAVRPSMKARLAVKEARNAACLGLYCALHSWSRGQTGLHSI